MQRGIRTRVDIQTWQQHESNTQRDITTRVDIQTWQQHGSNTQRDITTRVDIQTTANPRSHNGNHASSQPKFTAAAITGICTFQNWVTSLLFCGLYNFASSELRCKRCRSSFRHYATSRKVAGSIPAEVNIFDFPNPFDSASSKHEYEESSWR
jgi:hypothetical protein